MKTPKELSALARELRLTKMQIAFCHELAVNGGHQGNAAKVAGAQHPDVQGSRWAKLERVRRYLGAITEEAIALTEKRVRDTVAGVAEILTVLTAELRARPQEFFKTVKMVTDSKSKRKIVGLTPDFRRIKEAPTGVVTAIRQKADGEFVLETANPQVAAARLLEHYELTAGLQPQTRTQPFTVNFLTLDEKTLRLLDRAQAEFETTAARAGKRPTIEATAKRLG